MITTITLFNVTREHSIFYVQDMAIMHGSRILLFVMRARYPWMLEVERSVAAATSRYRQVWRQTLTSPISKHHPLALPWTRPSFSSIGDLQTRFLRRLLVVAFNCGSTCKRTTASSFFCIRFCSIESHSRDRASSTLQHHYHKSIYQELP